MAVIEQPPLPREHGAWGILLVPFASAVGIAGVWNLPVTLLLVSVLAFFMARMSFLKHNWKWAGILLTGSAAAAAPLLIVWHRYWLAAFCIIAAPLAFRKTERHLAIQLLAMTGLTLTAPAAWYVATGNLDTMAWKLWLFNSLYFAGGFLFVKMHIAAAIKHTATGVRAGTIIYHAALIPVLLATAGTMTWAFVPGIARAFIGAWRLSPKLQIKRLAWAEVTHSVVFGSLLIVVARQ